MLVAANLQELVHDGENVRVQPATLSTYRIGNDGTLTFVRSYNVETKGLLQFWSGFARL